MPGQEAVDLRNGVRAYRVCPTATCLDDGGDGERRAERVGIGVLMPDGQDPSRATQSFDDRRRNRVEVRAEIDAHR